MSLPFEQMAEVAQGNRSWATPGDLARHIDTRIRTTPALDKIDQTLLGVYQFRHPRTMIFMPPQEGKSQRVSRTFPLWVLLREPALRVAVVSYELESATRWGREIRRDLLQNPDLGLILQQDSKAAGRWETTHGGGLYCVGIGGALTGRPVDVLIIDDPVKDRAQAESRVYRDAAWEWWESVGSLRLSRFGRVVLMMTRWHEDDLAGRLLKKEPGVWEVLRVPAIADRRDDPLGREIGVEMDSATKTRGHFYRQRELRSPYVWSSVYQQDPAPEKQSVLPDTWQHWTTGVDDNGRAALLLGGHPIHLSECYRFMTVDLAASTKTSADYTVAAAWAVAPTGDILLLELARDRVSEEQHFDLVARVRNSWLGPYDTVYLEDSMMGTTLVYSAGRSGIPVRGIKADTDKLTRALPAADLIRQRRIWLPNGADWEQAFRDEIRAFPNGAHDDQVDVLGYAARIILTHWVPTMAAYDEPAKTHRADDLDWMNAPL